MRYSFLLLLIGATVWIHPITNAYAGRKRVIQFVNKCQVPIWVGSAGNSKPNNKYFQPGGKGGWKMGPIGKRASKRRVRLPVGWAGRFWPRTGCNFNKEQVCSPPGVDCCDAGGCLGKDNKTFSLKCKFSGVPPVPLLEFALDAPGSDGPYDTYDISMVDGFNVPIQVKPVRGSYNRKADPDPARKTRWCGMAGCSQTPVCPDELQDADGGGCWSPCQHAVRSGMSEYEQERYCCACTMNSTSDCSCEQDCCSGHFGCSPYTEPAWPVNRTCNPFSTDSDRNWPENYRNYITNVKDVCPWAYAWQFDDHHGTFNCRKTRGRPRYQVVFCPSKNK